MKTAQSPSSGVLRCSLTSKPRGRRRRQRAEEGHEVFTGWSEPREAPPQARDGLLEASSRRAGLRSTRAEPVETPAWGSPGGGKGRRPEMGRRGRTGHGGLAEGEAEAGSPGGGGSSGRAPADRCHLSGTRQEGRAEVSTQTTDTHQSVQNSTCFTIVYSFIIYKQRNENSNYFISYSHFILLGRKS